MEAEVNKELEQNDLARNAQELINKAKTGQLINPRILGLILACLCILGLFFFLTKTRRDAASAQWQQFKSIQAKKDYEEFASAQVNTSTMAGKLAKLQLARTKLTVEGTKNLSVAFGDTRLKAIDSIVSAKSDLEGLVKEFSSDATLKSQCLELLAKAELALVGIPTKPGDNDSRGSVENAVNYYKSIATTLGDSSKAGKDALETAKKIETNKENATMLGQLIQSQLTPISASPSPNSFNLNPTTSPFSPPSGSSEIKTPASIEPVTLPKVDMTKPPEPQKTPEMPKAEAPKAETPKADAPKVEAPRVEAPKTPDVPKVETPKTPDIPKPDAPKVEAPKADAPKVETPKTPDVPKQDAPKVPEKK